MNEKTRNQPPPTLLERILTATYDFASATGKRPAYVYLGYAEYEEMARLKSDWVMISRGTSPPTIDGKRVFVVNCDSHLAVS